MPAIVLSLFVLIGNPLIVMAIMGGAILPKLMGYVADQYDMSRAFIVPMACFAVVALIAVALPSFKCDS